jgi:hypothetical protein
MSETSPKLTQAPGFPDSKTRRYSRHRKPSAAGVARPHQEPGGTVMQHLHALSGARYFRNRLLKYTTQANPICLSPTFRARNQVALLPLWGWT